MENKDSIESVRNLVVKWTATVKHALTQQSKDGDAGCDVGTSAELYTIMKKMSLSGTIYSLDTIDTKYPDDLAAQIRSLKPLLEEWHTNYVKFEVSWMKEKKESEKLTNSDDLYLKLAGEVTKLEEEWKTLMSTDNASSKDVGKINDQIKLLRCQLPDYLNGPKIYQELSDRLEVIYDAACSWVHNHE